MYVCMYVTADYELAPQKGKQSTSYLGLTKPKLNRIAIFGQFFENCRDSFRGLVGSVLAY